MIRKGDIYFVRHYNANPRKSGRPAVVLSGENINRDCDYVVLAYLSSSFEEKDADFCVPVSFRGKRNYVMVQKLSTVTKNRLASYAGCVSDIEKTALECAMCKVLEL